MPLPNDPTPMSQFQSPDRKSILAQLQQAGLLDFPELDDIKVRREVGAGNIPHPKDGMAPMITSVPQADR